MTQIQVGIHEGAFRCYRTELGTDRRYFGPRFGGPTSAARYADDAARDLSPATSSAADPNLDRHPDESTVQRQDLRPSGSPEAAPPGSNRG